MAYYLQGKRKGKVTNMLEFDSKHEGQRIAPLPFVHAKPAEETAIT